MSSHERAIRDFTTALTLLGSKQAEDDLGGSPRLRETSSAAELREHDEGAPGGGNGDAAATAEPNAADGSCNAANPRAPHEPCSPGESNASSSDGDDQEQPRLEEELGHRASSGENGRLEKRLNSNRSSSRRLSHGADAGDGMAEGGSVVGACYYAR